MRIAIRTLLLTGLVFGTVACLGVRGSGNVVTRDLQVERFSRVEVSSTFDVTISIGETPSVHLRFDDNFERYLDVDVSEDTLRLQLEPMVSIGDGTLEAEITIPSLLELNGSGASSISLPEELSGEDLQVELSGASTMQGGVDLQSMTANVSGASNLTLSGRAVHLVVEASGASELRLANLEVEDLEIELSGATSAEVSVSGTISADVSGASSLLYHGSPDFTRQEVSGASEITQAP